MNRPVTSSVLRSGIGILSANGFNNLVALGITATAAAVMGVEEFAPLGLALSIVAVVALVTDFGLSIAVVRAYNVTLSVGERAQVGTTLLAWKVAVAAVITGIAGILPHAVVSDALPLFRNHPGLLFWSVCAGSLQSIWLSIRALEQARERFGSIQRYTALCGIARTAAFVASLLLGEMSAVLVVLCLYQVPLGLLFATQGLVWAAQHGGCAPPRPSSTVLTVLLSYAAWSGISATCFIILQRLPVFALSSYGTPEGVGIFTAALTFLTAFSLLNDAARVVLLPAVVRAATVEQRAVFRAAVQRRGALYSVLMLFAVGASALAYRVLLGEPYQAGVPVLVILATATAATIYLGLQNALVHSLGKPHVDAVMNIARVVVLTALVFLSPPVPLTLACVFAAVLVVSELVLFWYVRRLDKVVQA